jgi:hypothetical protein
MDKYYLALGKFVHAFAQVEGALHMTFPSFARMDARAAYVIKKDMNSAALVAIIKGLMIANSFPEIVMAEALEILKQFEHIAAFRHRVIHRGSFPEPDGTFKSTNILTAKNAASVEQAVFEVKDIEGAAADLRQMPFILLMVAGMVPRGHPGLSEERAPWRYKPVPLTKLGSQRPAATLVPPLQPPASPA